ncbi:Sir2 family NAD-dependent protein deacetylase [Afifella sp. IM 167]|uniref:SIR2 family NAD-dependent protein deacylase n=1 Tax=Afifella sp. IM 167 TaxID=2033586 RepID=UPI001CCF6B83|nr:Sir2 family NAD-dependent protein deacetylase [Afifella sp. IM 167]MBZ8134563.1 NAD-dependent deacetylase [Afifella sp. IM 167]
MAAFESGNGGADELRRLLDDSQRIVAFTGAGISTESGIPDFRSPGGIWSRMEPITFQKFVVSEEARLEDWRRRFEMNRVYGEAQPNIAHVALAHLVAEGRSAGVVTQNIDGLHVRGGLAAESLVELHGNATYAHCISCRRRYELDAMEAQIEAEKRAPRCEECGGFVKSAIVSFGEAMPEAEMRRALDLAESCDLMLVLGSSLQVQPAAGIPVVARRAGARLAILNRESTHLDGFANLALQGEIGAILAGVFPQLAGELH